MDDIKNIITNLKLDVWYKIIVAVASAALLLSLSIDIKGVENTVVQLISLGSLFIGLGEWIQHPKRDQFIPASYLNPNLVITIHERKTTLLGSLFDILGFVILYITT